MSKVEDFLTADEESEIVEAIRLAEEQTTGEIRVHIERATDKDALVRAREVFHELNMDVTELQNGVLIYLAVDSHTFAICGDKGINDRVEADFWDCTKDTMLEQFRKGNFKQGLIDGITRSGQRLKELFPWQEGDTNELTNEISRG
jgi:uncharacterized membrane protein